MAAVHECGICTDVISKNEEVITLSGNPDSTSYNGLSQPYPFSEIKHTRWDISDGTTPASPEIAPVHHDCYRVFRKECALQSTDALSRLWILATWRYPWKGALPLGLSGPSEMPDRDTLGRVARLCGLSLLSHLPLELVEIIRAYSEHSFLWRCIAALRLATRVSNTDPEPLLTVSLNEILSWERNGKLERATQPSSNLPTIRLTIDSGGISKVERLPCTPLYSGQCLARSAFVVTDEASVSRVVAHLKDGFLRLQIPDQRTLPIWNTPAPPDLSLCRLSFLDSAPAPWRRFHAVEPGAVRGITFFFYLSRVYNIHIHASEESCALSTYEGFADLARLRAVWVYLPITQDDQLLALGVRENSQRGQFNILVRTKLSGDVIIGTQQQNAALLEDRYLGSSAPITFVYGEPGERFSVPFIGAYCGLSSGQTHQDTPKPFPRDIPSLKDAISFCQHYSWAPLEGISSTLVLYDENTGYCRGIVINYENSGSRAVGQCRLHVDPGERVVRPTRICFRTELVHRGGRILKGRTQVKFKQGPQGDQTEQEGWKSRPLKGIIQFWFRKELSIMAVEN